MEQHKKFTLKTYILIKIVTVNWFWVIEKNDIWIKTTQIIIKGLNNNMTRIKSMIKMISNMNKMTIMTMMIIKMIITCHLVIMTKVINNKIHIYNNSSLCINWINNHQMEVNYYSQIINTYSKRILIAMKKAINSSCQCQHLINKNKTKIKIICHLCYRKTLMMIMIFKCQCLLNPHNNLTQT